jgi:hypothetical protein
MLEASPIAAVSRLDHFSPLAAPRQPGKVPYPLLDHAQVSAILLAILASVLVVAAIGAALRRRLT